MVAGNLRGAPSAVADDIGGPLAGGNHNLIGTGGPGGLVNGVNGNLVGVADAKITPFVNALGNYARPLAGSPVLDAGDNASVPPGITRDAMEPVSGVTFPRIRDAVDDVDTIAEVDIGAYELHPTIAELA